MNGKSGRLAGGMPVEHVMAVRIAGSALAWVAADPDRFRAWREWVTAAEQEMPLGAAPVVINGLTPDAMEGAADFYAEAMIEAGYR